jgi:hypothetical protein
MTTGRINQVTVLRARHPQRMGAAARGSGYRGSRPFPGQSKSPTDQSRPPAAEAARRATHNGRPVQQIPQTEFLVPRSHTPQGRSPRSGGPESNPSEETTGERPHLRRGLPERGGSPIDWLRSDLAQRLADPHHSPQLATASKALCRSYISRLQTGHPLARPLEPGHGSLPKRAHPARQAHQPLGPGTASRPQAVSNGLGFSDRAESTPGLSAQRSRHPFKLQPTLALRVSTLTAREPSRPATTPALANS